MLFCFVSGFVCLFFLFFSYTSEAIRSSMVDVKADEPNDGLMACHTGCWGEDIHRIK